jgi:hypothetical protein
VFGDHGGVDERTKAAQGRLTSDEVAAVLRRAAALDAAAGLGPGDDHDAYDDGRYDADAVEAAAGEVGVSATAVRQAVAELRVGALAPVDAEPVRRGRRLARRNVGTGRAGGPPPHTTSTPARATGAAADRRRPDASPVVVEQRLVAPPPDAVLALLERRLKRMMFEVRRRGPAEGLYRPRTDLAAKVARKVDLTGRIRLEGVQVIAVHATPADGQTLVRVEATMAVSRTNVVAGSAGAGAAVAVAAGFGGALLADPALVVVALPAGGVIAAGGLRVRGRRWQRQRDEIAETLAGVLDDLT